MGTVPRLSDPLYVSRFLSVPDLLDTSANSVMGGPSTERPPSAPPRPTTGLVDDSDQDSNTAGSSIDLSSYEPSIIIEPGNAPACALNFMATLLID